MLRQYNAMPVSSRRCGMITTQEADRLVNSFLDENKPPALPQNFFFEIEHACGFGCTGVFYPSRYNSSRAKCIRCKLCGVFLSPNKFVFHMHESTGKKYVQPETTKFNSWRRYIKLSESSGNNEQLRNTWNEVKAIFNGGKRKRPQHQGGNSPKRVRQSFNHDCEQETAKNYTEELEYAEDIEENRINCCTPVSKSPQPDSTTQQGLNFYQMNPRNQFSLPVLEFLMSNPIYSSLIARMRLNMEAVVASHSLYNLHKNNNNNDDNDNNSNNPHSISKILSEQRHQLQQQQRRKHHSQEQF